MDRLDIENLINANISDNTTRNINPGKVRATMGGILDYVDSNSAASPFPAANLIIKLITSTPPTGVLADAYTLQNALTITYAQFPEVTLFELGQDPFNPTLYIAIKGLFTIPSGFFQNNTEILEIIDLTGELKSIGSAAFKGSTLQGLYSATINSIGDEAFAIAADINGKYNLNLTLPNLHNTGVAGYIMGVTGHLDSGIVLSFDRIMTLFLAGTSQRFELNRDLSGYSMKSAAETISGQKTFTGGIFANDPFRSIPIISANVGSGDAAVFETGSAAGVTIQSRSANSAILNIKSISGTNAANAVTRWWVDSFLTLQLYCGGTSSYWYPRTAAFDAPGTDGASILFMSRSGQIWFAKDPNNYQTINAFKMNQDGVVVIGKYTKAQRDLFTHAESGVLIWQTDNNPGLYMYDGTAWNNILTLLSGIGQYAIPYGNAAAGLTYDANFKYDGNNLQIGNAGLFGSNRLNFNGGRGYIESASGGFIFAVTGGPPADSSKSISFKNVTREWLLLYLPAGDASTTPLEGKASMNFSPESNKSHNLGKSGTRWNKVYAGNLNAEIQTAPASATDTGEAGEIRVTSDYVYVCVAANTWKRTALSTW